jgi:hypothetical protein
MLRSPEGWVEVSAQAERATNPMATESTRHLTEYLAFGLKEPRRVGGSAG